MKPSTILLLVLSIGSVSPLKLSFYKVRNIRKNLTQMGVHNRIYGGMQAVEGQFPFMIFALMKLPDSFFSCSGSLISLRWVLTAAHCLHYVDLEPSNVALVGGEVDLLEYVNKIIEKGGLAPEFDVQQRRAEKFFIHPNYSEITLHHDVGLIMLEKPFVLGNIQTIPLSMDKMKKREKCTILGWGLSEESQSFKLKFVENKEASTTEIGCKYLNSGPLICLTMDGSGFCQGDSGSPLVCDGKVFGVASFYSTESKACSTSVEDYYSELYPSLDWILSVSGSGNAPAVSPWFFMFSTISGLWLSGKF